MPKAQIFVSFSYGVTEDAKAGITVSAEALIVKCKKGKAGHLYSALHGIQTTLKRSGMDHTVLLAINTMPAS